MIKIAQEFRHLFSPIQINTMTVKNRVVSEPHAFYFYDTITGHPTDRAIAYLELKAKGGVGLIGTWLTSVNPNNTGFHHPEALERFRKMGDALHKHGAKVMVQLCHRGGQAGTTDPPYTVPFGPSAMHVWGYEQQPYLIHEMSIKEIKQAVAEFAYGAKVCREAGIDCIQLHGAHGYLLYGFLSPTFNRRTDEYGGSLENRLRLPLEVIDAVREAVGYDYPVGYRISGDEFVEGGLNQEDIKVACRKLAEGGKIDFFDLSAGSYVSTEAIIEPMYFPLNSIVYLAAGIKEAVDVPVIGRGRIIDPVQAEQVLANNQADMVAMTRANIADPEWCKKSQEGRLDEIRKCAGCLQKCWGMFTDLAQAFKFGMSCTINPVIGRETWPGWADFQPTETKKRVMVIGGGPAGLELARVATERGHMVSLYEKDAELGGQILIAAKAPGRDGYLDVTKYYNYQVKLLGIDVHLEAEITADMVKKANPDAVVVATGSIPYFPEVPGIDQENVVEVRGILEGKVETGDNVLVIDGQHGIQSLIVADFLASQGKKVEVICPDYYPGHFVERNTLRVLLRRLLDAGVVLTGLTKLKSISGNEVTVTNIITGKEQVLEKIDTIVVAYGGKENNSLYYALEGQVKELYAIGDCFGSRDLPEAILAGATLGRKL